MSRNKRGAAPLRIVVATGVAGGGHVTQAEAIVSALRRHRNSRNRRLEVRTVDVLPAEVSRIYRNWIRPGWRRNLYGRVFHATNRPWAAKIVRTFSPSMRGEAMQALLSNAGDLVVSTHPLLLRSIIRAVRPRGVPVVCWCPEIGRANNHASYSLTPRADLFLFASPLSLSRFDEELRIPGDRLRVTGFPLRQEFYERRLPAARHRAAIGLAANRATLLLTAGAEGEGKVLDLVRRLAARPSIAERAQIAVVCGRNEPLFAALSALTGTLPRSFLVPLRYAPPTVMRDAIGAADLVVGLTAGVTQLMETIVFGQVPFFAAGCIAGQEDENLDLIREFGIGVVNQNSANAAAEIEALLAVPGRLRPFEKSIATFRAPHIHARRRIAEELVAAAEAARDPFTKGNRSVLR